MKSIAMAEGALTFSNALDYCQSFIRGGRTILRPIDQIMHKAAWLYYMHGLRQDEVAKQLDISRASVALYLRRARESGIVNISTSTTLFQNETLARELEDLLRLKAVWIVPEDRQALDPAAEMPVPFSST
jgi:DNA-binding transcriptional regulator LsrR (DeoR family)